MFRALIVVLVCTVGFPSLAQDRKTDLAAFDREYRIDSAVVLGKSWLQQYRKPSADRNRVACRVIDSEVRQGNFEQADSLYKAELAITSDSVQRAFLYRSYALLKSYREEIAQAELYLIRALKIMQRYGNRPGEVAVLIDFAELSRKTFEHETGFEYIRRAKKAVAAYDIKDPRLLAQLYNREAALLNQTAKNAASVSVSEKALRYAEQAGDLHLQAVSRNELGFAYGNLPGRKEEKEAAYAKAEELWLKAHMYQDATLVKFNVIEGLTHKQRIGHAESNTRYRQLLQFIDAHGVQFAKERIYSHMTYNYAELGDYENAYRYARLHREAEGRSWEAQSRKDFDRIREEFRSDLLKKEAETAQHQLKSSRQLVERKQYENTIAIIAALILAFLLAIIGLLYYRTRRDKRTLQREGAIKDSLIQEIHHRVKNNLQFVSSLMNMQVNASNNDTEIYALNDASRRIKSMALVHEMLYNHDDKQVVSLKTYLEELLETLKELSSGSTRPVRFVAEIADIQVSVNQSVALGMICSELVSNALKYAFTDVQEPCISLVVETEEGRECRLTLRDNGRGIENTSSEMRSLGMRLIDIFSRQLKGTYAFGNDNGLVFHLRFHP